MPMLSTDYAHSMQLSTEWLERADQLHLGLHIHPEGIQMGLFEMHSKQPIWLMNAPMLHHQIPQALIQGNWSQPFYRKVSISFTAESWTLAPQNLFDPLALNAWIEPHANAQLGYQNLTHETTVLIHRHPMIIEQVAALFPQAQVNCATKMWLQLTQPSDFENTLFAWMEADKLCIHLIQNHQRILVNQFDSKSAEDALYFISAALQDFNHVGPIPIVLMGMNVQEDLLELLRSYYSDVQLWNTPLGLQIPSNLNQSVAYYYSILMHTLCV